MRYTGIAVLITVSVMTANYLAGQIKRRIMLLERFLLLIKRIKTYIEYSKTPLLQITQMLESGDEFAELTFLSGLRDGTETGNGFLDSWQESIKSFAKSTPLTADDARLMCDFARVLGSSDVKGQLENCDTYIQMVSQKLDTLRPKAENTCKVYNCVGILVGSFLAILFI